MRKRHWLSLFAGMVLGALALATSPVFAGGFGDGFGGGAGAGLAYLATQFCALTGCSMTGQQVFSGVTTDISTGTNQDLTITPNGTGKTVLGGTGLTVNGTAEFQSSISNTTGATCFTGVTGTICVADPEGLTIAPTTVASAVLNIRNNNTSGSAAIETWDQSSARMGAFGSFGSALAAGYASKTGFFTRTTFSTLAGATTDFSASSPVFEVRDGAAASFADLNFAVYGSGVVKWRPNTAAAGITCNSSNEGMEYVRVIAASNKSGKCLCTQTSSGVYAWTISYTGGGTALVAGDC